MEIITHVSVTRRSKDAADAVAGIQLLKRWAQKALIKTGSLRAAARLSPPAAVILTYHSVRDEPETDADWIGPGITHATKVFARHMELIARQFNPVSLEEILLFLEGRKKLPRWAVAVTFDDGFLDNLEVAAPVLERFSIPAAFYLTVGLMGQPDAPWYSRVRHAFMTTHCKTWRSSRLHRTWDISDPSARDSALVGAYEMCAPLVADTQQSAVSAIERELEVESALPRHRFMMNWEEAKALSSAGHVVGSHTVTHPNIAHVSQDAALRAELFESKRQMEEHLHGPVTHFSYPHPALKPQWSDRTLAMTREAGYTAAVTTTSGPVRMGANPLLLSRINAPRPDHEFLWNLERAFSE